jgi:CHAT domain-containing protein/Tfp pilus assembly protein PilF
MRRTLRVTWIFMCATLLPASCRAQQDAPGMIVEEIMPDSLAAKAGLKIDDRILSYDGKALASPTALDALAENTFGKKEVTLEVGRGGESLQLSVGLGALGIQVRPELPVGVNDLYEQGQIAFKAKDFTGAIAKWEAAAKLARAEGWGSREAWLCGRIGENLSDEKHWKEAIDQYLQAWRLSRENGDAAGESRTLTALGRCERRINELTAARDRFEQARQIDSAAGNERWEADDLNNVARIDLSRGDLQSAKDYLVRALSIQQHLVPNSLDVAHTLNHLGEVERVRGDLENAKEEYTEALSILERFAPDSEDAAGSLAGVLINLGTIADGRGDLQSAKENYTRALSIQERLAPDSLDISRTLNNFGLLALEEGDLAAAQAYGNRALSIKERLAPDSLLVASSLDTLGSIALARNDFETAQNYYSRALSILDHLGVEPLGVSTALNNLGLVARKRGQRQAAQDYYNRALSILDRLAPNSPEAVDALSGLGGAALQAGRLEDAKVFFARGVKIVESQRSQIFTAESRALFVANHTDPYLGLIRVYLANQDQAAAYSTSERAHARGFLELLTEARTDIRQGIEPSILERERSLQEAINAKAEYQTRVLSEKHTDQEAAALAREIDSLTVDYHEVEARIRATSPHYAALTQPQPLDLEAVQKQVLDRDSLLLEYSLGEEASFLFVVSQSSIKSYPLPRSADIQSLARQVYETLTSRNRRTVGETAGQREIRIAQADADYPKLAAELSQMVLAPAEADFGNKRLLIVADGILLQMPFAALPDPADADSLPLILRHEIVSLPSASVLALQRRELANRKTAPKQLAVFGDPVFERGDERFRAIAAAGDMKNSPTSTGASVRDLDRAAGEAGLSGDRLSISRLLFSRQEADRIFAFSTPNAGIESVGFDASKQAVISSGLSKYRMLHFATHALFNNDHPELSGIVLSLVDRRGRDLDGFLRLNEIYNLNLPADLVVLSACQTGLGKQIKGEGLIGLVRGFMYAGAERVVASLWKVDDAATADLMVLFYRKMLKDHETVPAALRDAEIELSHEKHWASPYFWAGFEMQGEWRAMQ